MFVCGWHDSWKTPKNTEISVIEVQSFGHNSKINQVIENRKAAWQHRPIPKIGWSWSVGSFEQHLNVWVVNLYNFLTFILIFPRIVINIGSMVCSESQKNCDWVRFLKKAGVSVLFQISQKLIEISKIQEAATYHGYIPKRRIYMNDLDCSWRWPS